MRPRSPRPGRRSPGSRSNRSGRRRSRSTGRRRSPGPAISWSSSSCRSANSSPSLRSRMSWRAARAKASWLPSVSLAASGSRGRRRTPTSARHMSTIALADFRRRGAQKLLAGDQADHVGDRRVVLGLDAGMAALVGALAPQGREIVGDAGHAAGAQRLDADLLDRLEDRARGLAARHAAQMRLAVVVAQLQRHRIGLAAHAAHILDRQVAGRHGDARLAARAASRRRARRRRSLPCCDIARIVVAVTRRNSSIGVVSLAI